MNHARPMRRGERLQNLTRNVKAAFLGESASKPFPKRFTVHQLHDQIVVPDIMQRADVGMIQCGHRARLAPEAFPRMRIIIDVRRQYLDRDGALQPRVVSFVDLPHPAAAEQLVDAIRSKQGAGFERWSVHAHRGVAKLPGLVPRGNQRFDLTTQRKIGGTDFAEEGDATHGIVCPRDVEDFRDLPPALRSHAHPRCA